MHWLYLVVGLVFLAISSLKMTPMWLVVVLVIGSLGLFLAWMLGWMAERVGSASRSEVHILGPEELRQLREQAEARKAAADNPRVEPVDPDDRDE